MKQLLLLIILLTGINYAFAQQWHQVNSNTTENIYDMFFLDSLEGYCVGGSDYTGTEQSTGVILKTIDGGENWNTIFSIDSFMIKHIAIVQENSHVKLYAFALKNDNSYLISTFLSTMFQNWSVVPISYKPENVNVQNNSIFYKNLGL